MKLSTIIDAMQFFGVVSILGGIFFLLGVLTIPLGIGCIIGGIMLYGFSAGLDTLDRIRKELEEIILNQKRGFIEQEQAAYWENLAKTKETENQLPDSPR